MRRAGIPAQGSWWAPERCEGIDLMSRAAWQAGGGGGLRLRTMGGFCGETRQVEKCCRQWRPWKRPGRGPGWVSVCGRTSLARLHMCMEFVSELGASGGAWAGGQKSEGLGKCLLPETILNPSGPSCPTCEAGWHTISWKWTLGSRGRALPRPLPGTLPVIGGRQWASGLGPSVLSVWGLGLCVLRVSLEKFYQGKLNVTIQYFRDFFANEVI